MVDFSTIVPTSLANDRVGIQLYECLREIQPSLQVKAVLRLELEVEDELELPVVWLLVSALGILWNLRQQSNSKVKGYQVRSQLEEDSLMQQPNLMNLHLICLIKIK